LGRKRSRGDRKEHALLLRSVDEPVQVHQHPGKVMIDISDTGKGMSSSHISKVFNPGFTTKKRGWGLGLTLSKRIIEDYHNGHLAVKHSEIGKGTTFRITIPMG
jgi:signal transduction histidine kinase